MKKYNVAKISWIELFIAQCGDGIARRVVDLIKKELTDVPEIILSRPKNKTKPFPLHPSKATVKRLTKELPKDKGGRPNKRVWKDGKIVSLCKTKGCKNFARTKGLCSRHYQMQRYHSKHPKAKVRKS